MSHDAIIATKEKVNELRAKQRGHSLAEIECAKDIQWHSKEQSRLEDEIIGWEVHLAQLKAEEAVKDCDTQWTLKRIFHGKS